MEEEFNSMRKRKDYRALGSWFWDGFMLTPKGATRDALSALFNSLSQEEKDKCEEI